MSKSPAFQLYAADFLVDTADWTPTQVGAYFRLLMTEWVNGPLSSNMSDLARIAGISDTRTMVKIWNLKLGKKFTLNGGNLLYNKRLEETREEQQKWRQRQVESGRLGGLRTQEKNRIESSDPSSNPSSQNQALQSSSSSSSSKDKKIYTSDFESFWNSYPKKVGKKGAFRAWKKAKDKPGISTILKAIENQNKSKQWLDGYIPNPETWINQGRWMDEIDPQKDWMKEVERL